MQPTCQQKADQPSPHKKTKKQQIQALKNNKTHPNSSKTGAEDNAPHVCDINDTPPLNSMAIATTHCFLMTRIVHLKRDD